MNIIVYMKYNLRNENKKDIRKNFIKKENFYEKNIDHVLNVIVNITHNIKKGELIHGIN